MIIKLLKKIVFPIYLLYSFIFFLIFNREIIDVMDIGIYKWLSNE